MFPESYQITSPYLLKYSASYPYGNIQGTLQGNVFFSNGDFLRLLWEHTNLAANIMGT